MKPLKRKRWIGRVLGGAALVGGLLTGAGLLRLGLSLPTATARGLVVASVIYMVITLGARAAGISWHEPLSEPTSRSGAESSTTHGTTGA